MSVVISCKIGIIVDPFVLKRAYHWNHCHRVNLFKFYMQEIIMNSTTYNYHDIVSIRDIATFLQAHTMPMQVSTAPANVTMV